jgi:hypothetical protein
MQIYWTKAKSLQRASHWGLAKVAITIGLLATRAGVIGRGVLLEAET